MSHQRKHGGVLTIWLLVQAAHRFNSLCASPVVRQSSTWCQNSCRSSANKRQNGEAPRMTFGNVSMHCFPSHPGKLSTVASPALRDSCSSGQGSKLVAAMGKPPTGVLGSNHEKRLPDGFL